MTDAARSNRSTGSTILGVIVLAIGVTMIVAALAIPATEAPSQLALGTFGLVFATIGLGTMATA